MDLNPFAALADNEVIVLVYDLGGAGEIQSATTLGALRRVSQLNQIRAQAGPQDHDQRRTRK